MGLLVIAPDLAYYLWWEETRQTTKPVRPDTSFPELPSTRLALEIYHDIRPLRSTPWNGVTKPMWAHFESLPDEVRERIPPNGGIEEELYTAAFRKVVDWEGNPVDLEDGRVRDQKGKALTMEIDPDGTMSNGFLSAVLEMIEREELPPPRIISVTEHAKLRSLYPGQFKGTVIARVSSALIDDSTGSDAGSDGGWVISLLFVVMRTAGWYITGACVLIGLTAPLWHHPDPAKATGGAT